MSDDSSNNPKYDPDMAVVRWRQHMELATVCVANAISLCVMIVRVIVQRKRFKRLRKSELQTAVAAILLCFPLWTSQIMTNRYGSGMHVENVPPEWAIPFWNWSLGWMAYYVVVSMVKVSMCYSLLEILPHTFRTFRRMVYALCVLIMSLGIAEALVWTFQCQPFMANFDYSIPTTWCANIDAARFAWAGVGIGIDLLLTWIPIAILQRTRLMRHERMVLRAVFGATLLGTAATAVGCYSIWLNREDQAVEDLTWTETIYIMFNSIEITLYTIGGSLTVFSRYFISRVAQYSHNAPSTNHTASTGFSIFSKNSHRKRKHSVQTIAEDQLHSPNNNNPHAFSVNATAALPAPWESDEPLELQSSPLPPPTTTAHAMAALHDPDASKWHTWESSYGVPASRDTIDSLDNPTAPATVVHVGVLPDIDYSPPPSRNESRPQQPFNANEASLWYPSEHSSINNSGGEEQQQRPRPPPLAVTTQPPVVAVPRHAPSGSTSSRKFHLPFTEKSQSSPVTHEFP